MLYSFQSISYRASMKRQKDQENPTCPTSHHFRGEPANSSATIQNPCWVIETRILHDSESSRWDFWKLWKVGWYSFLQIVGADVGREADKTDIIGNSESLQVYKMGGRLPHPTPRLGSRFCPFYLPPAPSEFSFYAHFVFCRPFSGLMANTHVLQETPFHVWNFLFCCCAI